MVRLVQGSYVAQKYPSAWSKAAPIKTTPVTSKITDRLALLVASLLDGLMFLSNFRRFVTVGRSLALFNWFLLLSVLVTYLSLHAPRPSKPIILAMAGSF